MAALVTALAALGEDLGDQIRDARQDLAEVELEAELAPFAENVNLRDLSTCIALILGGPPWLKKAFPSTQVLKGRLHQVRTMRNRYAHNDPGPLAQLSKIASDDLDLLVAVATSTGLPVATELALVRGRMTALAHGQVFDQAAELAAQQQTIMELQSQHVRGHVVQELKAELADTKAMLVASQHAPAAGEDVRSYKAKVALLEAQLAAKQEKAARTATPVDINDLLTTLMVVAAPPSLVVAKATPASAVAPWDGPVGTPMTLSKQNRDVYDPATDTWLCQQDASLRPAVEGFLKMRPTGGRIWVSAKGDVVTLIDNARVLIGSLRPQAKDPAPGSIADQPPTGPKYSLHLNGDVTCKESKTKLASVRLPTAKATGKRLLRGRPDGGQIQVGADGTVRSMKNSVSIFVGRVAAEEWFPGVVQRSRPS